MELDKTSKQKTRLQDRHAISLINTIRRLQNDELNNNNKDPLTKMLAEALTEVIKNYKPDNDRNTEVKNNNTSEVANSGNSDVDIKIHIDLSSIAFAILYSLYASKQLSSEELETAISRLETYNSK